MSKDLIEKSKSVIAAEIFFPIGLAKALVDRIEQLEAEVEALEASPLSEEALDILRSENTKLKSELAEAKRPDFREMREMLRAMHAGELTVSRGVELLEIWHAGNYSDDMLPPVRQDLIEEDSMPVEIIDRLKAELATVKEDRDEWKDATRYEKARFKNAEKELAALKAQAQEPVACENCGEFDVSDKHCVSGGDWSKECMPVVKYTGAPLPKQKSPRFAAPPPSAQAQEPVFPHCEHCGSSEWYCVVCTPNFVEKAPSAEDAAIVKAAIAWREDHLSDSQLCDVIDAARGEG